MSEAQMAAQYDSKAWTRILKRTGTPEELHKYVTLERVRETLAFHRESGSSPEQAGDAVLNEYDSEK